MEEKNNRDEGIKASKENTYEYVDKKYNRIIEIAQKGSLRPVEKRLDLLNRLREAIREHEDEIYKALKGDLNKPEHEALMTELSVVMEELNLAISRLKSWSRPSLRLCGLTQLPGYVRIYKEPYGAALIISPWNYPFQLAVVPMISAIAAGNTVMLKMSESAPNTARVVEKIVDTALDGEVCVFFGEADESVYITGLRFDYIFYTGNSGVARSVMKAASKYLTPVTLELGGKSPVIIDRSADLKQAARSLAFGKLLNSGQTCVAPDYILVDESIKSAFIDELIEEFNAQMGDEVYMRDNFVRIINRAHFKRIMNLLKGENIIYGGDSDEDRLIIEPTIVLDSSLESPIMSEEIFGTVFPVIGYGEIDEAISFINSRPKPLALYLFSEDRSIEHRILEETSSGGATINDTVMHLASSRHPFGGVGESGMGAYHGKYGFDTFTHQRTVLKKLGPLDMDLRYHPYTNKKRDTLKKLLRLIRR